MDNTDRAETVHSWLTKQKSHEIFRSTASTVDIPSRWDPRAKQSRTVALLAALCAAALFEPLPSCRQKEKPEHKCVLVFLGAMEGTRTPGLLIRRNRMAHFVHFIIRRKIVILIELTLFCRCYSIASFALLALLCTCYPSLRCAENVQKCAEPKSARQDGLKLSDFPAGFLRHQQHKNSQFYPNNNLT